MSLEQIMKIAENDEKAILVYNKICDFLSCRTFPTQNSEYIMIKPEEVTVYRLLFFELYELVEEYTTEEFNKKEFIKQSDRFVTSSISKDLLYNHLDPVITNKMWKILESYEERLNHVGVGKYFFVELFFSLNPEMYEQLQKTIKELHDDRPNTT